MKLLNLNSADLSAAAAAAGGIKYKPTVDGGYFQAQGLKFRAKEGNGATTWSPCLHGWKALHAALCTVKGTSYGWAFWVNGFKITGTDKHKLSQALATWGKSKQGILCACEAVVAAQSVATHGGQPMPVPPPVPPPPPPGQTRTMPLAKGPALTDGDTADRGGLRNVRSFMATLQAHYVIEEMYVAARDTSVPASSASMESAAYHDLTDWARRLMTYRKGYSARLARNLFDTMVLICWHECRESSSGFGSRYTFPDGNPLQYDPRSLLPGLERCFQTKLGYENHSYGGFFWARIARFASRYFDYVLAQGLPGLFIDTVVDLTHNGQTMTNKGIGFDSPNRPKLLDMLDRKREGLLSQDPEPLTLTEECYTLLREATRLRVPRTTSYDGGTCKVASPLCPPIRAQVATKEDHDLPSLQWGTKEFTFTLKPGGPTDQTVADRQKVEDAEQDAKARREYEARRAARMARRGQPVPTPSAPATVGVAGIAAILDAATAPPTVLAPDR